MIDRLPRDASLEAIVDRCVEELLSARVTLEDCLAAYPEHREALEPLLRDVQALASLPIPAERAPTPERRAAFMTALQATPQLPARRLRLPQLPFAGGLPFSLFSLNLGGIALRVAPAAVVAMVALALVLTQGGGTRTASAATLTVFAGAVEERVDGEWQPLDDGAHIREGMSVRTLEGTHALLTFADGSTAALLQSTEVSLDRVSTDGPRDIEITQATGRLWNDVVTTPGEASYVVRTPHATVEAHGTVFETVVNGDTAVSTTDGLVRVVSATDTVEVTPGQIVRATANAIAAPELLDFIGEITVRAPMAAALTSADGAATGLLPSGVVFRQVPGVTTTVPARDELQHLFVGDVEPGVYSLILRRFEDGDGIVVIETATGRLNIPVPANVQTARVLIAIDVLDGSVFMRALDSELETVDADETPDVRVVESERTRDAVDLERAVEVNITPTASPSASPTDDDDRDRDERDGDGRSNGRDRDDDDRDATPGFPRPTATVTLTWEQQFRLAVVDAIRSNQNTALLRMLDEMFDGGDRQDEQRLRVLSAVLDDPVARIRILAVTAVGMVPDFSRRIDDAIDDLDDRDLRNTLRDQLSQVLRDRKRDDDDRGDGPQRQEDRGEDRDGGSDSDNGGRDDGGGDNNDRDRGRFGRNGGEFVPDWLDRIRTRVEEDGLWSDRRESGRQEQTDSSAEAAPTQEGYDRTGDGR